MCKKQRIKANTHGSNSFRSWSIVTKASVTSCVLVLSFTVRAQCSEFCICYSSAFCYIFTKPRLLSDWLYIVSHCLYSAACCFHSMRRFFTCIHVDARALSSSFPLLYSIAVCDCATMYLFSCSRAWLCPCEHSCMPLWGTGKVSPECIPRARSAGLDGMPILSLCR